MTEKRGLLPVLRTVLPVAVVLLAAAGCGREKTPAPQNRTGPLLYVTNEMAGTVTVVDPAKHEVVSTITVGKRPRGIRTSQDGKTVFVALSGSPMAGPGVDESTLPPPDRQHDGIGVIDVASGRLTKVLNGGTDPEQFALSSDGKQMFIANEDAGEVTVLEIATGVIVKKIKVGGEPEGVDLSPDGKSIYVTAEGDNQVFVIDTTRLETTAVIDVGPRPRSTAFAGTRAYVSAENDAAVYVIDTATHKVLTRLALTEKTLKPMGIVSSPDGRFVYATTGRGGTLLKIDTATNTVAGSLAVGERPWGVAMSADGRWLFTANGPSNDISIVDTSSWAVAARVGVGERPWGVAIVP
jgi:YVTN family beta-propeller protein